MATINETPSSTHTEEGKEGGTAQQAAARGSPEIGLGAESEQMQGLGTG